MQQIRNKIRTYVCMYVYVHILGLWLRHLLLYLKRHLSASSDLRLRARCLIPSVCTCYPLILALFFLLIIFMQDRCVDNELKNTANIFQKKISLYIYICLYICAPGSFRHFLKSEIKRPTKYQT